MHRFLIQGATPDRDGKIDLSPIVHQLQRVLRVRVGAEVVVLDGTGCAYITRLVTLEARAAWGQVLGETTLPEPAIHLTLYQCALKADKFEWVLQKGAELGVSCFVPVVSARAIVRPVAVLEKKRDRWETILREATEQCGRGRAPRLAPARDWADAMAGPDGAEAALPSLKLLAWEEATGRESPHVQSLGQAITSWREHTLASTDTLTGARIACCIGPEGGLEASEVELARAAGWQIVRLGPRVLRAETAALAATAVIMQLCGELELRS
jgi:16S rRNA (uracil1498-N3)-methyltransferase